MSAIDFSDPAIIAFLEEALTAAGVDGLEISQSGGSLRIVVSAMAGPQVSLTGNARPGLAAVRTATVKAPMAGHFYPLHSSDSDGAERLPRTVAREDVIGFIRIGSLVLPIPAGQSGRLTKQLMEPDALAGFGDPLFEIEPIS